MNGIMTAGQELASARQKCGLPAAPASRAVWSFRAAGVAITLPNFSWRRRAIDKHDLHHLVLGEPFTLKGECQVAIWEFAAGPYPDIRAQLFCLPLVALGAISRPRSAWRSYVNGTRRNSLYRFDAVDTLPLSVLAERMETDRPYEPVSAILGFAALMTASASLYFIAVLLIVLFAARTLQ